AQRRDAAAHPPIVGALARPSAGSGSSGERHVGDRVDADDVTWMGGVDHLTVAQSNADVTDRAVEEHQVPRLQLTERDPGAHPDLGTGGTWKEDPSLGPGHHGQPGAVPGVRALGAIAVGLAELGQREIDSDLALAGGR